MVIQSDEITMKSRRQYASRRTTRQQLAMGIAPGYEGAGTADNKVEGSGNGSNPLRGAGESRTGKQGMSYDTYETDGNQNEGMALPTGSFLFALMYTKNGMLAEDEKSLSDIPAVRQGRMSDLQRVGALSRDLGNVEDLSLQMKFSALNYLFQIFFHKKALGDMQDMYWGSPTGGSYQTFQFSETYEEVEMTSFETTGKVVTEDGRELEFNLNVGMSRSFYEETNLSIIQQKPTLLDPLIINISGNVDAVSDQTFYFDLDADGEKEEIASLNPGHGFLALDKNGDGEIGDGSELFGALSGNGFEELAAYDLDGNGWIDEADEVFDKLRVWSLDENGNPQMFSLRESDIGAICLASAPTQFSITDELNATRGVVRQTGFFLHESSGMAGSVQQIDLAEM